MVTTPCALGACEHVSSWTAMKLEAELRMANWMSCRVCTGRASNLPGKPHDHLWSQTAACFLPPFFQWPRYKKPQPGERFIQSPCSPKEVNLPSAFSPKLQRIMAFSMLSTKPVVSIQFHHLLYSYFFKINSFSLK